MPRPFLIGTDHGKAKVPCQAAKRGECQHSHFHLIARGRKRRNYIPALTIDSHVVTKHEGMESALHTHFSGVFGTAPGRAITLNLQALGIQQLDLAEQEPEFTSDEVWNAIKELPADRALGRTDSPGLSTGQRGR